MKKSFLMKALRGLSILLLLFSSFLNLEAKRIYHDSETFYEKNASLGDPSLTSNFSNKAAQGILAPSAQMASSQCPNIQLVDMRGLPGYPDVDFLNMCGEADTLSVLVFTDLSLIHI